MKRAFFAGVFILSLTVMGFGQATTFYYPQVANGLQGSVRWKTKIFVLNPAASGTSTASVTIQLFKDVPTLSAVGTPFNSIVFTDENGAVVNSGNTFSFQIAGGQSRQYVSTGDGDYGGGYAVVTSNVLINGSAVFSEFDGSGRLLGEAGVAASSAVTKQALFVDTIGNYDVGFALVNPSAQGVANVSVALLNSSASVVATTTLNLGGNNHTAQFVGINLFPTAPKLAGTMQITGSVPLTTVALRFDPSYSVFTSMPPSTIASLLMEPLNALQRLVSTLVGHFA